MYNYKDSKANIINNLDTDYKIEERKRIPKDKNFNYENGVKTWIDAVFIDIVKSSKLFKSQDEKLVRLMRSFISEVITILQDKQIYHEIGIRGDCVYAIYSTPEEKDSLNVFDIVCTLNTFMKMFNKLANSKGYKKIKVGIGVASGYDIIVKTGRNGTGINDKIWIGDAVVDAANLSSIAGRGKIDTIAMNECFYDNIKEELLKENPKYEEWVKHVDNYRNYSFYQANIVQTDFSDWIEGGFKG